MPSGFVQPFTETPLSNLKALRSRRSGRNALARAPGEQRAASDERVPRIDGHQHHDDPEDQRNPNAFGGFTHVGPLRRCSRSESWCLDAGPTASFLVAALALHSRLQPWRVPDPPIRPSSIQAHVRGIRKSHKVRHHRRDEDSVAGPAALGRRDAGHGPRL